MTKHEYINSIRQEYSGLRDLPRESLASSVKTLADDLYAKDTHFIFELIQNAEDNEYGRGVFPKLRFEVCQHKLEGQSRTVLIVHNNESGFLEKHIRAICQVGKSTKNKAQGYIGEKGIGFKSVFRITTCPYVFSNGFQFCLPEHDAETGLGYIVPRWVTNLPEIISINETTIILPINKNQRDVQAVVNALKDIAPETILFLQKLCSIEISVNLPESNAEYEVIIEKRIKRKVGASKLVEMSYIRRTSDADDETCYTSSFWLTEIEFEKPGDITHEKRRGIDSRVVSIAIPLEKEPTEGKLFAYLPVWENTGLPFLVNADFLLVSSREGVREDEEWNKWLRDCIVETYTKAFLALMDAPDIDIGEKFSAYASIPLESHYSFLTPIIKEIQRQLMRQNCILVLPDKTMVKPKQSRLCHEEIRNLIVSKNNFPCLIQDEIRLVCPEIELFPNQLKQIGVEQFSPSEVVSCLKEVAWVKSHQMKWFVDLFRYLCKQKETSEFGELQNIPIVPVEGPNKPMGLSCDDEQPIYFALGEEEKNILADVPGWLSRLVPIAVLNPDFLTLLDQQEDSDAIKEWLTDTLNIYDFSVENFCVDILSKLASEYEKISEKRIIEATKFLAEHSGKNFKWERLPIILSDGRKLLLSDARKLPAQDIVVPESCDKKRGWQHIWSQKDDCTHFIALADVYSLMPKEWFDSLKIKFYPPFKRVQYKWWEVPESLHPEKQLADQCYKRAASSRSYETCITSYIPPTSLMQPSQEKDFSKSLSQSLLSYLRLIKVPDDNSCNYKKDMHELGFFAYGVYQNHGKYCQYNPGSILEQLRKLPWLPTTKGFVRPSQDFLPKQSIKEILGNTVPYFSEDVPDNVIRLLEVRSDVTVEELLRLLRANSGNSDADPDMADRVYSELHLRTSRTSHNIKALFSTENLILVKDSYNCIKWLNSDECVWEDATDVLGSDYAYLQVQYPKLKGFFVERLGVKERVDTECFARRWIKHQESPLENKEQQRTLVERLYREIKAVAQQPEGERPVWWSVFSEKAMLYTQSDTFVKPEELVLPDDGELGKIFQGCVDFAWRPPKDAFNDWLLFYKSFNVSLISETVTEHLEEDVDVDFLENTILVTDSTVKMIAAWLREKRRDEYERLLEDSIFSKLLSMKEATTSGSIQVEFRLETEVIFQSITETYPVFWERSENVLIYQYKPKKNQVAKILAKGLLVKNYKDFAHWIELILGVTDTDRLKDENWSVPQEILDLCRSETSPLLEPTNTGDNLTRSHAPHELDGKSKTDTLDSNVIEAAITSIEENKEYNILAQEDNALSNTEQDETMPEHDTEQTIDYHEEIRKSFNKDGMTSFNEESKYRLDNTDYSEKEVKNPIRRGNKLENSYLNNIRNEPSPEERRKVTERSLLEGPKEAIRTDLYEWYDGKCQVCGDTWPKRDGNAYFAAGYLVKRHHARWLDEPGNAICLCAKHFAQWNLAAIETKIDVIDQIRSLRLKSEGGNGNLSIKFRMFNEDFPISYVEPHLLALRKLLDVTEQVNVLEPQEVPSTVLHEDEETQEEEEAAAQEKKEPSQTYKPLPLPNGKVDKFTDRKGHEVLIVCNPVKQTAPATSVKSTLLKCPYCDYNIRQEKYQTHIKEKCPKRPAITGLSHTTQQPVRSAISRCRFCDSPAMAGTDVCYSCGG